MKYTLPQANDLDKVISVFLYVGNAQNHDDESIAKFCKFDARQSKYYLAACYFLGLVDSEGNQTEESKDAMANNIAPKRYVYGKIVSHKDLSRIVAQLIIHKDEDAAYKCAETIVVEDGKYHGSTAERRADVMFKWCKIVVDFIKNNK